MLESFTWHDMRKNSASFVCRGSSQLQLGTPGKSDIRYPTKMAIIKKEPLPIILGPKLHQKSLRKGLLSHHCPEKWHQYHFLAPLINLSTRMVTKELATSFGDILAGNPWISWLNPWISWLKLTPSSKVWMFFFCEGKTQTLRHQNDSTHNWLTATRHTNYAWRRLKCLFTNVDMPHKMNDHDNP